MTPLASRSIAMLLRPAQRACTSRPVSLRTLTTTSGLRASGIGPNGGNAPPMEPLKQRMRAPGSDSKDLDVGELEGASFRVEPLRRVGEDDSTMRARLTYQSRKRGTLESDLLLSTFADTYLPTMTREQMAQYDLFLDENDWDIYYWATQEPPPTSTSSPAASTSSNTASPPPPPTMTEDTNSAAYGSAPEAITAETSSSTSTGGQAHDADALESKGSNAAAATAAASEEEPPYRKPGEGEWAQTVGTFKPAYRPVPARWRDSEVLRLLREHVKAKARERGGMAFMPRLRV
ncbi:Flavinator of succinate dehydrogenase-domain-containing protein [Biscogniauxia mediterranea]|nr:Flavinator of succinate dehydrogenase-domain-containing protein [Biscogniauxia mediterranea]